jgi:hypothetical protein
MLRDPPTASGLVQATHSRDHPWTLSNVIKVLPWTVVFAVCWAASPTLAESPTNTAPGASGSHNASASVPGSTPIVRLECGTAIAVGKHVQRACRLIGEILRDPQIQRNKKLEAELYLTIDALRKRCSPLFTANIMTCAARIWPRPTLRRLVGRMAWMSTLALSRSVRRRNRWDGQLHSIFTEVSRGFRRASRGLLGSFRAATKATRNA